MLSIVDLFAGCGGLSLGMELAGFVPILAAELNMSARCTYERNRPWMDPDAIVEDVRSLSRRPSQKIRHLAGLSARQRPTIVAGGPPCQGFSGIGHRRTNSDVERHEIASNHLYKDMVRVIHKLEPEAFLFENVRGILSARWARNSDERVWDHVRDYFLRVLRHRYVIAFQVVNGYDYGVPQNRPRVLMLGLRRDHWGHDRSFSASQVNEATRQGRAIAVEVGLLPAPLLPREDLLPDLVDLLGDLVDEHWQDIDEKGRPHACTAYPANARGAWQEAMRAQFSREDASLRKGALLAEQEYSRHSTTVVERFRLVQQGRELPSRLQTKKFALRALPRTWDSQLPRITIASLPDDYVHFEHPRALTVREWARMQGFPDWYEFCGPRTTGGHRRAGDVRSGDSVREAPKYTQIGNAVPVPLAAAVGWHLRSLLNVPVTLKGNGLERTLLGRLLGQHYANRKLQSLPAARRLARPDLTQTSLVLG